MIGFEDIKISLSNIESEINELRDSLDIGGKQKQIASLEKGTTDPHIWEDTDKAQKIFQKIKHFKNNIEEYNSLRQEEKDLADFVELSMEENDYSELDEVKSELAKLIEDLNHMIIDTLLSGKYDKNNAILTLHAGEGGAEAQDWAQMLFRMYVKYAENKGFKTETIDYIKGEGAGIKSATFLIEGLNAYGYCKCEEGVHQLERISPLDSSSGRHTSFASLGVMPEIEDEAEVPIEPDDLRVDTYHSSGPGGQNVNKTDSAIRITHIPTGIVVTCQSERSQHQNREYAMKVLRAKLAKLKEKGQEEEIQNIKGAQKDITWGSRIRSYIFHPYSMVKDHRTDYEVADIDAVMDGDIDDFIFEYLKAASLGKLK